MPDKRKAMVACANENRPAMGRPRKFKELPKLYHVLIPQDLQQAVERHQQNRKLGGQADALRDLLREAAEARNLVSPRE